MNTQFPEISAELNRQRIEEEMKAIRLEEKATKGKSLSNRLLAGLGYWMVKKGQKLRARNTTSFQTNGFEFGKDAGRKLGA